MAANQPPWPREWLMTDERIGFNLWEAVAALPRGAGVVFRNREMPEADRGKLGRELAKKCRDRGLVLAIAGDVRMAVYLKAALVHNPSSEPGNLPFSRSAHSREEAESAWSAGASFIFLSPIFPTRSHPRRMPLSKEEVCGITAACPVPVIALGGMSRERFEQRKSDGFYGWAGIDAWLGEFKI